MNDSTFKDIKENSQMDLYVILKTMHRNYFQK